MHGAAGSTGRPQPPGRMEWKGEAAVAGSRCTCLRGEGGGTRGRTLPWRKRCCHWGCFSPWRQCWCPARWQGAGWMLPVPVPASPMALCPAARPARCSGCVPAVLPSPRRLPICHIARAGVIWGQWPGLLGPLPAEASAPRWHPGDIVSPPRSLPGQR